MSSDRPCSVDGCDGRGVLAVTTDHPLCYPHYQRRQKAGLLKRQPLALTGHDRAVLSEAVEILERIRRKTAIAPLRRVLAVGTPTEKP